MGSHTEIETRNKKKLSELETMETMFHASTQQGGILGNAQVHNWCVQSGSPFWVWRRPLVIGTISVWNQKDHGMLRVEGGSGNTDRLTLARENLCRVNVRPCGSTVPHNPRKCTYGSRWCVTVYPSVIELFHHMIETAKIVPH